MAETDLAHIVRGASVGDVRTHFYEVPEAELPFELDCGVSLPRVTLAWEQYGEINERRDNVVLLFHALTGCQHAAGTNTSLPEVGSLWTDEMHLGWWDDFIGPGRALDTDELCVLCANYLGGCYGSTGPTSIDAESGMPYGRSFPEVTLRDTVRACKSLVDSLGVETLHAVIGASTGGMACLSYATEYPDGVSTVIPIATGSAVTPLQRIHNFEQIQAIENDPGFDGGHYKPGTVLWGGMGIARMICHKTFVSLEAMEGRARESVTQQSLAADTWYGVHAPIESYMVHQAQKFAVRFDANAYLRILAAWNNFDLLAKSEAEDLVELFSQCRHQRYLVFSIDSDVCYYPPEQRALVELLEEAEVPRMSITVHSDKGHDSFLTEPALYTPHLRFALS